MNRPKLDRPFHSTNTVFQKHIHRLILKTDKKTATTRDLSAENNKRKSLLCWEDDLQTEEKEVWNLKSLRQDRIETSRFTRKYRETGISEEKCERDEEETTPGWKHGNRKAAQIQSPRIWGSRSGLQGRRHQQMFTSFRQSEVKVRWWCNFPLIEEQKLKWCLCSAELFWNSRSIWQNLSIISSGHQLSYHQVLFSLDSRQFITFQVLQQHWAEINFSPSSSATFEQNHNINVATLVFSILIFATKVLKK